MHEALVRFTCSQCQRDEFTKAQFDPEDQSFMVEKDSPVWGWVAINVACIGLAGTARKVLCNQCQILPLQAMGYATRNFFENAVKENTENVSVVSADVSSGTAEPTDYLCVDPNKSNN